MTASRYETVVRSGYRDVFETLGLVFGPAAVRWDRRRGDRRVATVQTPVNRRRQDWRGPPSRPWVTAGVVVAVVTPEPRPGQSSR